MFYNAFAEKMQPVSSAANKNFWPLSYDNLVVEKKTKVMIAIFYYFKTRVDPKKLPGPWALTYLSEILPLSSRVSFSNER